MAVGSWGDCVLVSYPTEREGERCWSPRTGNRHGLLVPNTTTDQVAFIEADRERGRERERERVEIDALL